MITYLRGDATKPQGEGLKVICHCVNDLGLWGSGFVVAISKRWKMPEVAYREWHKNGRTPPHIPLVLNTLSDLSVPFELGNTQFVQVEKELWVANIIGQHSIISYGEKTPVRYDALAKGFETVQRFCVSRQATAHMPRLGCGLAGGAWGKVEPLIQGMVGVSSYVYDLDSSV